ncbi:hypothetical protein AAY473_001144 [Plecturocebus cupreus]
MEMEDYFGWVFCELYNLSDEDIIHTSVALWEAEAGRSQGQEFETSLDNMRRGFTRLARMFSNPNLMIHLPWPPQSAGITGVSHHAWPYSIIFLTKSFISNKFENKRSEWEEGDRGRKQRECEVERLVDNEIAKVVNYTSSSSFFNFFFTSTEEGSLLFSSYTLWRGSGVGGDTDGEEI